MLHEIISSCSLLALFTACGVEGGLNQNGKEAGNEGDGVELSSGDIAVHPSGAYFVAYGGYGTLKGDPATGKCVELPGLDWPERIAFGKQLVFVTTLTEHGAELVGYDVEARGAAWSAPIEAADELDDSGPWLYPLLVVDDEGGTLAVAETGGVRILAQDDGTVLSETTFEQRVLDVDALPGGARYVVTTKETWQDEDDEDDDPTQTPSTTLLVIDDRNDAISRIDVPNCAAELLVSSDGRRAFMAPTRCVDPASEQAKDPVSVIDLESGSFERHLPGFGPAGATADGKRIIAFMDAENLDASLLREGDPRPEGGDRYHLMLIDPGDLSYQLIPVGDDLPRYAPAPDGSVLLLDTGDWLADPRVRVVDVAKRTVSEVDGPRVTLDDFAFTRDASRAFLIDDVEGAGAELFDLSVAMKKVIEIALDFTPSNLVVTPDDKWLLLRADEDGSLWAFDIAADRIARPLCASEHG